MRRGLMLRAAVSGAALVALAVGCPWWLVRAGWPLPRPTPSVETILNHARLLDVPDAFWIKGAALAGWVLWLCFLLCVLAEASSRLASGSRQLARLAEALPLQSLAAPLVAAIFTVLPSRHVTSPPSAVVDLGSATTLVFTVGEGPTADVRPPGTTAYVVKRWDTLSRIARRELGDPLRWREIWELNKYRRFGDEVFDDWDHIHKGWVLWLPVASADGPGIAVSPAAHGSQDVGDVTPEAVAAEPAATTTIRDAATERDVRAAVPVPSGSTSAEGPSTDVHPSSPSPALPADTGAAPDGAGGSSNDGLGRVLMPSGLAVTIGFALGAATTTSIARINRRRQYAHRPARAGRSADPAPREPLPALVAAASRSTPDESGGPTSRPPDAASPWDVVQGSIRVVGARSQDAARGILVAALMNGVSAHPRKRIITDVRTAEVLLGGIQEVEAISVLPSATEVLDEAEVERSIRKRLLGDSGHITAYRASDPDDLLDDVIVIGTATSADAGRWAALVEAGQGLGVAAVLIDGVDVGAPTVDAATGAIRGHEAPRAFSTDLISGDDAKVLCDEVSAAGADPLPPSDTQEASAEEQFPFEALEQAPPAAPNRVRINVFGQVGIRSEARGSAGVLRNAGRELLAYLTLHPEGLGRDVILEALWPDLDFARARNAFSNALKSLREDVRLLVGRADLAVVESTVVESKKATGSHYRLQGGLFDADLWAFQVHLRDAELADAPSERVDQLRRALASYGGEFAESSGALWAITAREDLRRRALDAAVTIAEAEEQEDNIDRALAAVEQAITLDVYAEDLYVRGVRLLVRLNRIESARELLAALRRQLAELDRSPMAATSDAIGRFISEGERRRLAAEALDAKREPVPAAISSGKGEPGQPGQKPPRER